EWHEPGFERRQVGRHASADEIVVDPISRAHQAERTLWFRAPRRDFGEPIERASEVGALTVRELELQALEQPLARLGRPVTRQLHYAERVQNFRREHMRLAILPSTGKRRLQKRAGAFRV